MCGSVYVETVESQFKVSRFKAFPYLVFIHAVLAKAPYTSTYCINYPDLVFLTLVFHPHLVNKTSISTWNLYLNLMLQC